MIFGLPTSSDPFNWFKSQDWHNGYEEGSRVNENEIKSIVKAFEKHMRKNYFRMTNTSTASTHKCSCDFCEIDEKE